MEAWIIETWKPEETYIAGQVMGRCAKPGQIFCLNGDLGVGKTVFTQGFASGLGVFGPVNSPTFTILQQYLDGRLPLHHFDAYRIGDVEEMEEIGYEDCFYGQGVCLIEWPERIPEILPKNCFQIFIEKDLKKGFDYRRIIVKDCEGADQDWLHGICETMPSAWKDSVMKGGEAL